MAGALLGAILVPFLLVALRVSHRDVKEMAGSILPESLYRPMRALLRMPPKPQTPMEFFPEEGIYLPSQQARAFRDVLAYLAQRRPSSLLSLPFPIYNDLAGIPVPWMLDLPDNFGFSRRLQREYVAALEAAPPELVLAEAVDDDAVCCDGLLLTFLETNPELSSREIREFLGRRYVRGRRLGPVWVLERAARAMNLPAPVTRKSALRSEASNSSWVLPVPAGAVPVRLRLTVSLHYARWGFLAKPFLEIRGPGFARSLGVPTDGPSETVRFDLPSSLPPQLILSFRRPGALNPAPDHVQVTDAIWEFPPQAGL
ncbi:MAG: hypothetical protein HY652_06060, partial [Acidobacteria bacterium]|nr:hypothetical protein [Acidobacteriota bacterium]